jgi:AcrR family transcriptional regulator
MIDPTAPEDVKLDQTAKQASPDASCPRSRAGRPAVLAGAERRALLLDAAARVFLQKGYAAATMHAIALDAGMSKKTIYQVFASKLALFDALLADRIFELPAPPCLDGLDAEEDLTRLLLAIADVLLLPDRMGLIRLIISDGPSSPELSSAFVRLQMVQDLNALETWLKQLQESGRLRPGDVVMDARMLFGMTIAEPILKALVNAPADQNDPAIEQQIRAAVRIFLRGLAAD